GRMDRGSHEAAYTIYIDRQVVQFTGFLVVSGDTGFCGTVTAILGAAPERAEETNNMVAEGDHLEIGSLLFEGLDQIDLTGPFEVLSRLPNSTLRLYGKTLAPVRDVRGLPLTPDAALAEAPQLDVLHIPGGFGQEALMDDAETLGWIARQAAGARC